MRLIGKYKITKEEAFANNKFLLCNDLGGLRLSFRCMFDFNKSRGVRFDWTKCFFKWLGRVITKGINFLLIPFGYVCKDISYEGYFRTLPHEREASAWFYED
jgi:hypothetical protein